jgi:hypothetical protein
LCLNWSRTLTAGDRVGFRPRKIKTQAHELVRELPIVGHNSHFAGIIRDLLNDVHLPVPGKRLIQEWHNARGVKSRRRSVWCRILPKDKNRQSGENTKRQDQRRKAENRFPGVRQIAARFDRLNCAQKKMQAQLQLLPISGTLLG